MLDTAQADPTGGLREMYMSAAAVYPAAVRAGLTPPVSVSDARAPLVIGLAALRSLHERRPVAVSEVAA